MINFAALAINCPLSLTLDMGLIISNRRDDICTERWTHTSQRSSCLQLSISYRRITIGLFNNRHYKPKRRFAAYRLVLSANRAPAAASPAGPARPGPVVRPVVHPPATPAIDHALVLKFRCVKRCKVHWSLCKPIAYLLILSPFNSHNR